MRTGLAIAALFVLAPVTEAATRDIGKSDPERKSVLDSLRPVAEADVADRPVLFLVSALRVSGQFAFVSGRLLQPDGRKFNYQGTHYQQQIDLKDGSFMDRFEAFLTREREKWIVQEYRNGANATGVTSWRTRFHLPDDLIDSRPVEKGSLDPLQITVEKHPGKAGDQEWTRIRIASEDVRPLCAALGDDLSARNPGYVGNGESYSCLVTDKGPIFGMLVGPAGEMTSPDAFGGAMEAPAPGRRGKQSFAGLRIEKESHPGRQGDEEWTRIRVMGPGAEKLCAKLGDTTDDCITSESGALMFTMLVGPRGEMLNYEAFGYK